MLTVIQTIQTVHIGVAKMNENLNAILREPSTVKPPNKGHFGDGPVVSCREVVLFSEVFF